MKKTFCAVLGLVCICAAAGAQSSLSTLTANNTAACPASAPLPSYCKQPFPGHRDTRPLVATPIFDAPAGNVSDEDLHSYLHDGRNTRIYANFMLGFCTTGNLASCHNNVRTGYNSNDDQTVAAQAEDLRRRHIDGAIMTWEGDGSTEDAASLKFQKYVDQHHCRTAQRCDPMYLIMYDGPSMAYNVESTGIPGTSGAGCVQQSGAAYEDCVVEHIRNDMCYMNGRHFGSDAYLKVAGRPVVQVFPDESVIAASGPAPSWADVWERIDKWNRDLPGNCMKAPYNAKNGVPLIVFEDSRGFIHADSSGSFAWIKVEGTDPATSQFIFDISSPSSLETLGQFYENARSFPHKMVWGAAFKGFNSSKAAWGTNRILDQACGQLWITSLTESNRYYMSSALPWLQIVTWNDYNEGTEIETGIDNCYTIDGEVHGSSLSWRLESSNPFASLSTVSHIEIYDSKDDGPLKLIGRMPAAKSGTWNLSGLSSGAHRLYVRMVGKNSILNRISPPVAFQSDLSLRSQEKFGINRHAHSRR